jgi:hypothetical protein
MNDPWAFGWTQLLTIVGFAITISIALGGFQSFARWQRQKFEEKRIDTAVDALVLIREMNGCSRIFAVRCRSNMNGKIRRRLWATRKI